MSSSSFTAFCSDEEDPFSRSRVERLIGHLEEHPLPHLTPNEHASLLVLILTALEVSPYLANILLPLISRRLKNSDGLSMPMGCDT